MSDKTHITNDDRGWMAAEFFHYDGGGFYRMGVTYALEPLKEPAEPPKGVESGRRAQYEREVATYKLLPYKVQVTAGNGQRFTLLGMDARHFMYWVGGLGICKAEKLVHLVSHTDGLHCPKCGGPLLTNLDAVTYWRENEISQAFQEEGTGESEA